MFRTHKLNLFDREKISVKWSKIKWNISCIVIFPFYVCDKTTRKVNTQCVYTLEESYTWNAILCLLLSAHNFDKQTLEE